MFTFDEKMSATERQTWLEFYQVAEEFRDLAPWNWLYDSNIFGVQDPVSGTVYYCCVMGSGGEVFALGMYPGEEGFQTYLNLAYASEGTQNQALLAVVRQRLIKVEFVDREEMRKPELDHLKALGLKYRGSRQWVKAEDFQPGYFPELISVEQARLATLVLRQAMVAALRLKEEPELIDRSDDELFLQTSTELNGTLEWREEWREFPEEELEEVRLPVNHAKAKALKHELEMAEGTLLCSMMYLPAPVIDGEERPYFPLNTLWIGYSDGVILGFGLFTPKSLPDTFEDKLYAQFRSLKVIPGQIVVDSEFAESILEPFCEALGIELMCDPDVPVFEEVTNMLIDQIENMP